MSACLLLALSTLLVFHAASLHAQAASVQGHARPARVKLPSLPHVTVQRHTAADLLARFRSTSVGAARLAEAHRIATAGTAAGVAAVAGKLPNGGSGTGGSAQPGGTQSTSSNTAPSASGAALDITIDPTQSMSASATVGGTTVQAGLVLQNVSVGVQVGLPPVGWLLEAQSDPGMSSTAWLSAGPLTPGWYLVAFEMQIPDDAAGFTSGALLQSTMSGAVTLAADCNNGVLSQKDSRGTNMCVALVQLTQSNTYFFTFEIEHGWALLLDAAISRVSP